MKATPLAQTFVSRARCRRFITAVMLFTVGVLFSGMAPAAVLPNSPTTQWTPFPYRSFVTVDYLIDQQTGTEEGDIVSTNGLPGAYMAFNPGTSGTNGSLGFRVRLGKDANPVGFKAVFHVGISAGTNGVLSLFVSVDNSGSSDAIRIFRAGTDLNISPSTTSIDSQNPIISYSTGASNYWWTNVSATIDPAVTNSTFPTPTNIDGASGAGETDYFLSYFVPFNDVVNALASVGITGVTTNTRLRYIISTATQPNSLNQDIGGLKGGISNPTNYNDLGILTPPINVFGAALPPVAVNDFVSTIVNAPVLVRVTTNDSSPDGLLLGITNLVASNGAAVITNGTNVLFTPANNFIGTAVVTYVLRDEIGGTSSATVTIAVTSANADIAVGKTGPASVLAGNNITYTITVTNLGPSTASNVIASDTLPASVAFVSASSGGTPSGNVVTWPAQNLAAGAATNFTVTVTPPTTGSITNRAQATSSSPDPDATNNNGSNPGAQVSTTITPQADVVIAVTGPANVLAAATYTYTVLVTNLGPSDATGVLVTNILPAGAAFVSATGNGVNNNGVITWPAFDLASGATTNFVITVIAPTSGSLTNIASGAASTGDPNPANNSGSTVVTTVTPQADIAVGKSGPASVIATSNLTYTITVTNLGPSAADNVVAVDTLPANVTFVSASSGGTPSGNSVTWPGMTLAAGAHTSLVVTVTAPASGAFTNVASASSSTSDPNASNNDGSNSGAQVGTAVTPQADVVVVVTGPATVLAGSTYNYTVSVTNLGPSSATNVLVTNNLPDSVAFITATGGGANNSGVVTWPAFNLSSGASTNFTINVTAPASGTLSDMASAASDIADPNLENNSGTAVTAISDVADLAVTIEAPATVFAAGNVLYRITVSNAGPSVATNVVVTNALPAGTTFVSANGVGATVSNNGGVVTWTVPSIPSGLFVHLFLTVRAPSEPGTLFESATGVAATADPNLANNTASTSTVVIARADIAVRKSGPEAVPANSNFTYTIVVTNAGPSLATNIVVRDFLPTNVTVVSASEGATFEGLLPSYVLVWPQMTLAAGEATNLTVTVFAPADAVVTNRAAATSPVGDPNPENNDGTATNSQAITTITPVADLSTFVSGPASVAAGSIYHYTVVVVNNGPSDATNVFATNALDASVTFISASSGGTLSGGNIVTWPAFNLANGQATNFDIAVRAPATGFVADAVSVGSTTPDPNLENNSGFIILTLIVDVADIALGKSAPLNVGGGSNFTYTISVTNFGPSIASNVVVTDHLPGTLGFVSASGGGALVSGDVVWPSFKLAANTVTNFTLTVTAPASGSATNFVSATADTADPDSGNNDGTNASNRAITSFFSGPQFGILIAPTAFNPQTGLFEQRVTVTNTGLSTVPATRLYVSGLRSNVFLRNASGTNAGVPYAQFNSPLDPGSNVTFLLEFYVVDRRPFTNTLQNISAEAVLPTVVTNAGNGTNIRRIFIDYRQANNPRVVVEFPTTPGHVYTILYSGDLVTWKAATPSITASANVTQWYDDGPPKTESRPVSPRYYRIVAAP